MTITNQTINVQADFETDILKLVGNAVIDQTGKITSFSGSVYKKSGEQMVYAGSFNSVQNLSITLDNRDDSELLGDIADATMAFIAELEKQFLQGEQV